VGVDCRIGYGADGESTSPRGRRQAVTVPETVVPRRVLSPSGTGTGSRSTVTAG
jgi:hypothetical protein